MTPSETTCDAPNAEINGYFYPLERFEAASIGDQVLLRSRRSQGDQLRRRAAPEHCEISESSAIK
jgi:hypothetical protein